MPQHEVTFTEADERLLARVQQRLNLASIDEAAEWLVKARLRRVARASNGRRRALYAVTPVGGQACE